jgi:hypothetical protein
MSSDTEDNIAEAAKDRSHNKERDSKDMNYSVRDHQRLLGLLAMIPYTRS